MADVLVGKVDVRVLYSYADLPKSTALQVNSGALLKTVWSGVCGPVGRLAQRAGTRPGRLSRSRVRAVRIATVPRPRVSSIEGMRRARCRISRTCGSPATRVRFPSWVYIVVRIILWTTGWGLSRSRTLVRNCWGATLDSIGSLQTLMVMLVVIGGAGCRDDNPSATPVKQEQSSPPFANRNLEQQSIEDALLSLRGPSVADAGSSPDGGR